MTVQETQSAPEATRLASRRSEPSGEVAAEYVRRSAAPTGGSLDAARAEVGYRVTEGVLLALGYNLFGFVGNGVDPRREGRTDRLYLRAEAWY